MAILLNRTWEDAAGNIDGGSAICEDFTIVWQRGTEEINGTTVVDVLMALQMGDPTGLGFTIDSLRNAVKCDVIRACVYYLDALQNSNEIFDGNAKAIVHLERAIQNLTMREIASAYRDIQDALGVLVPVAPEPEVAPVETPVTEPEPEVAPVETPVTEPVAEVAPVEVASVEVALVVEPVTETTIAADVPVVESSEPAE
jgi:hypothetical protein